MDDPDPNPARDLDPTPDPSPFFSDYKNAKKITFSYFFLITLKTDVNVTIQ
jgi:hypothetical protein